MLNSHRIVILHFGIALSLSLAFIVLDTSTSTNAQQTAGNRSEDCERGIQLYKQGDFQGAIKSLRIAVKQQQDDISAWHYLGLVLAQVGKKDDARKAHEKAAKVADALFYAPVDRRVTLPKGQLAEAAVSADLYLALSVNPSKKKTEEWHGRAELLRFFASDAPPNGELFSGKDVTTKVRVLSKPEPSYTELARGNQVTGTVTLRCVFAADGHVRAIHVVAGLPDGLTLRAILASQQIKFIPATKDGRPVSMWLEIQYNFNLY